jgi:hypothetical protein
LPNLQLHHVLRLSQRKQERQMQMSRCAFQKCGFICRCPYFFGTRATIEPAAMRSEALASYGLLPCGLIGLGVIVFETMQKPEDA